MDARCPIAASHPAAAANPQPPRFVPRLPKRRSPSCGNQRQTEGREREPAAFCSPLGAGLWTEMLAYLDVWMTDLYLHSASLQLDKDSGVLLGLP